MDLKWPKSILVLTALFILCINVFAEEIAPSAGEITKIEKRGKEIADYERAAIRATDLLLMSKPDQSKLEIYIAINHNGAWMVYFGKISEDGNEFIVTYLYSCPDGLFREMKVVQNVKVASKDILPLAKAVRLALRSIEIRFPKYNTNVFREEDGTITVYLTPGNEKSEVILFGGDFKLSISPDGTKVLNKTLLHKSVLELPLHMKNGRDRESAGAFHTHVLNDLPTETDIALILLNPQLAPHYIAGPTWFSRIDVNGKITILGKTEEILKTNNTNKQSKDTY